MRSRGVTPGDQWHFGGNESVCFSSGRTSSRTSFCRSSPSSMLYEGLFRCASRHRLRTTTALTSSSTIRSSCDLSFH